ncbi:putative L,D-transpeptidase YciB precursor [Caloramator mitchellensis]|uniref:Putative L,D-transpeptidase YciB n=1 Tax=Caloramator mitchellensis TaxID=908809 RepID=A0A0R3JWM4_CALMK|nr:L,D-transpeptidase family protein [Caloramator mitchellensis]KRQ87943.1 putative L,D-transpeptidase YciB precursor [Caloramator mitchellensis]
MKLKILAFSFLILFLNQFCITKITKAEELNIPIIKEIKLFNNAELKIGKKIQFLAEAEGKNLKYKWSVLKGEEIIYISESKEDNSFEFEFNEKGKYALEVMVFDEFGITTKIRSQEIEIKTDIEIRELIIDKTLPQQVGTTLNFTILASGNGLKYEWTVLKDDIEIFRSKCSNESIFSFTPDEAGVYKLQLKIIDEYGNIAEKTIENIEINNTIKAISLKYNEKEQQPIDTSLKFEALAEGYNLKYLWKVFKDGKEVYKIDTKNNILNYTIKEIGFYKVQVIIEDGFGNRKAMESKTIKTYLNRAIKNDKEALSIVNVANIDSKTNYLLLVDSFGNKVYIFNGTSNNWKFIKSMLCTDGKKSTPTVKGIFEINGRGPWLISYTPGVLAKYKVRFFKNYYFHSVLVNSKGKVIDGRLGQSLSHGCIRLSIENAKWIYDNIKDGSKVYII